MLLKVDVGNNNEAGKCFCVFKSAGGKVYVHQSFDNLEEALKACTYARETSFPSAFVGEIEEEPKETKKSNVRKSSAKKSASTKSSGKK